MRNTRKVYNHNRTNHSAEYGNTDSKFMIVTVSVSFIFIAFVLYGNLL